MSDATVSPAGAERATGRRDGADTRATILAAARSALLQDGYAKLSTRRVADVADVPLSQIHYHFGSKQQLILAVLDAENARLLERQAEMYAGPEPLWRQWERACEFLDADLESGYVRILQEMIAAGWSDPEVAAAVRRMVGGWFGLLAAVAQREGDRVGGLHPFTPAEIAALMGLPFIGAESTILLGFSEAEMPTRSALRKIGVVIRRLEEQGGLEP
ncbi:MAG TPA: TetR/AcrR family transcriptional regulator [Candidatus Limnocylindrales bacterium]|nr:TetR/AcrR family transcriptional regulator [Candidatus Limnocylindrales bacterium]